MTQADTRQRLPNRRTQVSFAFEWSQDKHASYKTSFVGSLGFNRAAVPLEVFLSCEKTTSSLESVGRDGAILISLLRQYGCGFDEMRDAITREEDGRAASLIGELLDQIEKITASEVEGMLR